MSKPVVVEFSEPCAWKPSKSASKTQKAGPANGTRPNNMPSFEEMKKSVMELGKAGKTRRERFKIEEARLVKLGCAPRKKIKAPLPILKGMLGKKKKREKAKKEAEREADIVTAASSKRRRKA